MNVVNKIPSPMSYCRTLGEPIKAKKITEGHGSIPLYLLKKAECAEKTLT